MNKVSVEALSSGFPQLKTTPHSEKSISFELDRSHSYPEAALLPRRSKMGWVIGVGCHLSSHSSADELESTAKSEASKSKASTSCKRHQISLLRIPVQRTTTVSGLLCFGLLAAVADAARPSRAVAKHREEFPQS